MQIFIKSWDGKTVTIDCEPSDTINTIGEKFENETDIHPCENILLFGGKTLELNRSLADYNIQKESTIHAVGRMVAQSKCEVIYNNDNKITIFSGCPICIKKRIQKIFGIKYECQELIVDGKVVKERFHYRGDLNNKTLILKLKLPENYEKNK